MKKNSRPPFLRNKDFWRGTAFVAAAIVFLAFICAVIVLHNQESLQDKFIISRIYAPFGILAVAMVTFFTVIWRGLVAARQVETAQAQLRSSNENNLALLLQKGAELLAERGNRAHVAAGLATLQAVITDENPKFAREAMELIADLVDERFQNSNHEPLCRAAINALAAGAERGYRADRAVDFEHSKNSSGPWQALTGVASATYKGGTFQFLNTLSNFSKETAYFFKKVRFFESKIDNVNDNYMECIFENCFISEISLGKNGSALFIGCDFSNSKISGSVVSDINFERCYFEKGSPPDFPQDIIDKIDIVS